MMNGPVVGQGRARQGMAERRRRRNTTQQNKNKCWDIDEGEDGWMDWMDVACV